MKRLFCIFSMLVILIIGSMTVLADPWAEPDGADVVAPTTQEQVME